MRGSISEPPVTGGPADSLGQFLEQVEQHFQKATTVGGLQQLNRRQSNQSSNSGFSSTTGEDEEVEAKGAENAQFSSTTGEDEDEPKAAAQRCSIVTTHDAPEPPCSETRVTNPAAPASELDPAAPALQPDPASPASQLDPAPPASEADTAPASEEPDAAPASEITKLPEVAQSAYYTFDAQGSSLGTRKGAYARRTLKMNEELEAEKAGACKVQSSQYDALRKAVPDILAPNYAIDAQGKLVHKQDAARPSYKRRVRRKAWDVGETAAVARARYSAKEFLAKRGQLS